MTRPIFIRYKRDIINVTYVEDVVYRNNDDITIICYQRGSVLKYEGDVRDDIWELMKLAFKSETSIAVE